MKMKGWSLIMKKETDNLCKNKYIEYNIKYKKL